MSTSLPNDELAQLAPLLASLARLIARGTAITEARLQMLLSGMRIQHQPEVPELARWSRLLQDVVADPDARDVAIEALLLLGLPEAVVLLAVNTVTQPAPTAPPPVLAPTLQVSTLQAHPPRLEWNLAAGEGVTGEIEVKGGPGQILVESDQVQVLPDRFGAEATRVQVRVRPLQEGMIWTSVRLVTDTASLDVPVLAQWQSQSAAMAPAFLLPTNPDMSGPTGNLAGPPGAVATPVNPPAKLAASLVAVHRLPVYFLVDISAGAATGRVQSLNQSFARFKTEILADPQTRDCVQVGVITYCEQARLVSPGLTAISNWSPPLMILSDYSSSRLDLAFQTLSQALTSLRDVGFTPTLQNWRPLVFVFVYNRPTDIWAKPSNIWEQVRTELLAAKSGAQAPGQIVAVQCGSMVDDATLRAISTIPPIQQSPSHPLKSLIQFIQ